MYRKLALLALVPCLLYWSPAAAANREFAVEKGRVYSLLVTAPRTVEATVTYTDPSGASVSKPLHAGDSDLYLTLKPRASGAARVSFNPPADGIDVTLSPLPEAETKDAQLAGSLHST